MQEEKSSQRQKRDSGLELRGTCRTHMKLPIENEQSQDQKHLEKHLIIQGGEREEEKGMQGGRRSCKEAGRKKQRMVALKSYRNLKFHGRGISQCQMQQ